MNEPEKDAPRICIETGKRSYTSKREARLRTHRIGHRTHAYQCEHCRGWHISNRDKQ